VFRGIEVLDKIVAAARDQADNPLEPITMTVMVTEWRRYVIGQSSTARADRGFSTLDV
jgi:hypothetical protein